MNLSLFSPSAPGPPTNDDWYTPRRVIECARECLGTIDLDPASCAAANDVVRAAVFYDTSGDGLAQRWRGRVWLNPPYSAPGPWVKKLVDHYDRGDVIAAVALLRDGTDADWFQLIASRALVMFACRRLRFWRTDHRRQNPLEGSAIFYLGREPQRFIEAFSPIAYLVNCGR